MSGDLAVNRTNSQLLMAAYFCNVNVFVCSCLNRTIFVILSFCECLALLLQRCCWGWPGTGSGPSGTCARQSGWVLLWCWILHLPSLAGRLLQKGLTEVATHPSPSSTPTGGQLEDWARQCFSRAGFGWLLPDSLTDFKKGLTRAFWKCPFLQIHLPTTLSSVASSC